ncbi:hypothetical protein GINT2_000788 [Glugoides intestinalis]
MPSPTERIMQVEKELQRYTIKKNEAKTLAAIGTSINERIKILNKVHSELVTISRELYYYDMVDYLGNLKIESLKLPQCTSLIKELSKAAQKFIDDREEKYLELSRKLTEKIYWVGLKMIKTAVKAHESKEGLLEFYKEASDCIKEKIRKLYFVQRAKDIEKSIRICAKEVEKHYQMLIQGEIIAFEKLFSEEVDCNEALPGNFGFYMSMIFKDICTKENKDKIKKIFIQISLLNEMSKVEKVFMSVANRYYYTKQTNTIEI